MKLTAFVFLLSISSQIFAQSFEIRGVLPWHNFLSGPTAWNEDDYKKYLDDCQKNNIFVPTMEGQYIIKNLMIISAALVVGGKFYVKNKN